MEYTYENVIDVMYPGLFWSPDSPNDPASRLLRTRYSTNEVGENECNECLQQFAEWFVSSDEELIKDILRYYCQKVEQFYRFRGFTWYPSPNRYLDTLEELRYTLEHVSESNVKYLWSVFYSGDSLADYECSRMYLNVWLMLHSDYPKAYDRFI